jgi:hypothetical protein
MIVALLLSLAAAQPAASVSPPVVDRRPPIDECAADASFRAFRTQLQSAIRRRDRTFILSILAPDVGVNFGGDSGRDSFAAQWRLNAPDTQLWEELDEALGLGCARIEGGGEVVAPSLANQLDDQEDASSAVVAVRSGAMLRERPDEAAAGIASLAWDVLTLRSAEVPEGWFAVRLADGREGYVRHADVRSPIDYRAYFRKHRGRWRLTAFLAGD